MEFRRDFGQVFGLESAIAGAVMFLVLVALGAAIAASRRRLRRGEGPSARAEHRGLEIGYAVIVALVAAFVATVSLTANARETAQARHVALQVRVTGFQWCWRFRYLGQAVTVTGQCAGHRPADLVLPSGVPVRVEVTSDDVVHSFWVPYLRWKIDAFPDHVNTFTVTLARDGRWPGRCAEFCGLYHYQMDFAVRVLPPTQFDRWLRARGGTARAVPAS